MLQRLPIVIAILIVSAGLAARVPHLRDPPLRFHATRQYWSALMARGLYVDHMRGLSPVETAAARAAAPNVWIEPPVMEYLAAFGYRLAGRETLAIPRLIAVLWWTAGALALWWLARHGQHRRQRHVLRAERGEIHDGPVPSRSPRVQALIVSYCLTGPKVKDYERQFTAIRLTLEA